MTPYRFALANVLIAFILLGSLYDIVRDEEHWPFSQYPMFNTVNKSRGLTWLRLYAVTSEGVEVPLVGRAEVFPFDQSRLSKAFGSIRERPDAADRLQAALENCLQRYERLRKRGVHAGPAASRLRLYEVNWTLDPSASNVDSPDSKKLVAETRQ
jgi:hypothetical protein